MTLPPSYSWYPRGRSLSVPYEASEGRRVNAIGAYFPDGLLAGTFRYETFATLPKHARAAKRKTAEEVARAYGLTLDQVGPIDAERFIAFVWKTAGRPVIASSQWKRQRPLMVVLDNYSVHRCQTVKDTLPAWERADIYLVYLPSYCPELSAIEPIWKDTKQNELTERSYKSVCTLKNEVDLALARKARRLEEKCEKSTMLKQQAA
jgi:transposase